MDGNGNMNLRNWGFLEPPNSALKSHLGLELMSSMSGKLQPNHENPMEYWMNHNRDKYLTLLPGNHYQNYYQPNYGSLPETSSSNSFQIPQQISLPKHENVIALKEEVVCEEIDNTSAGLVKKRGGTEIPKSSPLKEKKQRTKAPKPPKDESTPSVQRARPPKKCAEVVINGVTMDISEIPIPICSCTGSPQQCYRWGSGGWQSACCTTSLSTYPLPMSTKRRGARIAGRKMSIGAFKKVLEKLSSEGFDFSNRIDLKSYWAKHGTNKFVTIR